MTDLLQQARELLNSLGTGRTPGPWSRDRSSGVNCDVRAENGRKVALCWGLSTSKAARNNTDDYRKECDANAHFIAAGPDLQEALRGTLEHIEKIESRAAELQQDLTAKQAEIDRLREAQSPASEDVLAERERHKSVEGWTAEHDDQHSDGELAAAASTYAYAASISEPHRENISGIYSIQNNMIAREIWPFHAKWWKPTNRRRDLVKAGALILAEIERIDRAALAAPSEDV